MMDQIRKWYYIKALVHKYLNSNEGELKTTISLEVIGIKIKLVDPKL